MLGLAGIGPDHAIFGGLVVNRTVVEQRDGRRAIACAQIVEHGVHRELVDSPRHLTGMVEVRGPGVFGGYWRMSEKTASEFRADKFFITGDVGQRDEAGVLRLVGRAKDLIICGGLNVYPKEIEELIDMFPGVRECAVIGLPHPDFGEAVAVVVDGIPGQTPDENDIIGRLKGEIANFKVPKAVFFVDQLPRNAMGKVQKNVLREKFAGRFTSDASQ